MCSDRSMGHTLTKEQLTRGQAVLKLTCQKRTEADWSWTLIQDFSQGFSRHGLARFCKSLVQTTAETTKAPSLRRKSQMLCNIANTGMLPRITMITTSTMKNGSTGACIGCSEIWTTKYILLSSTGITRITSRRGSTR